MATANKTKRMKDEEIGCDLVITKTKRRVSCGGAWTSGVLNGFRFEGLVFLEHADHPDYELERSRISKLWLKDIATDQTVANFDRGWDIRPRTKRVGKIVDFLAAKLADLVYGAKP